MSRTAYDKRLARGDAGQAVLKPASLKTYVPKVCLQPAYLPGRDDRPDIAVGTHEHPITGCQSVGVAWVTALIKDIAARTERMDMQPRARRHDIALDLIAQ